MNAIACFAKGWRTLTAVAAFLVTGLLSVAGTLDLTPVVELFVKDPAMLGVAMVGIAALFGWLRYITNSPLGSKEPDASYMSIDSMDAARAKTDEGT